jgi:hypothetical protein
MLILSAISLINFCPGQSVGGGYPTIYKWTGNGTAWEQFGAAVAGNGDVNADGWPDLVVGSNGNLNGNDYFGEVRVFSGLDGSLLHHFIGTQYLSQLGYAVAIAGDVNLDGYADILVGAPAGPFSGSEPGFAKLYSGFDGTTLYSWVGPSPQSRFGQSVAGAGDIDGDGYDDFIIGAPFASPNALARAGSAFVYSGATGQLITQIDGIEENQYCGQSVAVSGDLNQDGNADFLVGSPDFTGSTFVNAGALHAYSLSGTAASLIWQYTGDRTSDHLGRTLAGGYDLNKDGIPDFVTGAPNNIAGGYGRVVAISGADASTLFVWPGEQFEFLGLAVALAGDMDGDSYPDVAIGQDHFGEGRTGCVYIYSGKDGSLLRLREGVDSPGQFGQAVASAGDINGDGLADIIVGAPETALPQVDKTGTAYVIGFNPYLKSNQQQLSASQGGTIEFTLNFTHQERNRDYKILASSSGTGPTVFGIEIPLTSDHLTQRTWNGGFRGAVESSFHGTLDSNGSANAMLKLNANSWPDLVGRTFHFAAVVLNSGSIPILSSVAVPISILD